MAVFRPDRSPDRPVRHLEWRLRLFGVAAILALVGMYFGESWVIWVAMGVLVAGLLVRFLPERGGDGEGEGHQGYSNPG